MVKLLLGYKAPINATNQYHFTPLHYAVLNRHNNVAIFLVNYGADLNITNTIGCYKRFSPFYMAILRSPRKVLKVMWDTGKVNIHLGSKSIFYLIRTIYRLKFFMEYCKLTPPSDYLNHVKKHLQGRYKSQYLILYNYLKSKGYYK